MVGAVDAIVALSMVFFPLANDPLIRARPEDTLLRKHTNSVLLEPSVAFTQR
jgi:hypothetical protein